MKKLMFAMAVAACAAAVQATTLTFGFAEGAFDTSKINYGTVYAMWADPKTPVDFSSLAKKDTYTVADFNAIGLYEIMAGTDQGTVTKFTASSSKRTGEQNQIFPRGVGGSGVSWDTSVYIVMISDNGAAYSETGKAITVKGFGQIDNDEYIATSMQVVPEPTSGLLLLLGVAGLALKRKRA